MLLQTDIEFQQTEIKNLNKMVNVGMFSTSVSGGEAFAAKRKIRELKMKYFDSWLWKKEVKIKLNQKK